MKDDPLEAYRKEAINAAWDLGYGQAVVNKILYATTESAISRIMTTARQSEQLSWRTIKNA